MAATLQDGPTANTESAPQHDLLTPGIREHSSNHVDARVEIGAQIGKFVIAAELARGGMGVVYLGHDRQLQRHAAIKLVRAHGPVAQVRMLREARALARVSHPNVVHVYEVGEHGQDVFVAMQFVDGCSLREWLASSPRSPAEILRCYLEAGRGLAAIHAAGLVHRDFKPDNVMVGRDGWVRVLDLGLAADRGPQAGVEVGDSSLAARVGAERNTTLTSLGACLGTPAYMAPEQHDGGLVDARADQFAFCVSVWEALHGERPFKGRTLLALASSVRRAPPAPANAAVSPGLQAVITRGLAADPAARWSSMNALLGALERAASEPELDRLAAKSRRRSAIAVPALLTIVVGAVAAGLYVLAPAAPDRDDGSNEGNARESLEQARLLASGGYYRDALSKAMDARRFAQATMSPGDAEYCAIGLSTVDLADQVAQQGALQESRMLFAIAIRFAKDCPYLDRDKMFVEQESARIEELAELPEHEALTPEVRSSRPPDLPR